eukprot:jgi/Botrbrau1/7659/Bobra.0159s0101.1
MILTFVNLALWRYGVIGWKVDCKDVRRLEHEHVNPRDIIRRRYGPMKMNIAKGWITRNSSCLLAEENEAWLWRLRCEASFLPASSQDDLQAELSRRTNYVGQHLCFQLRPIRGYNIEGKRDDRLGVALLENGDTFFGEYRADRKEGQGLYIFAGGGAYAGMYRESRRDGEGHLLLPDGSLYIGDFAADQFSGTGRYEYPDGSLYIGSWAAGAKHGKGTMWEPHGRGCISGTWEKGLLCSRTLYKRDKYHFEGDFQKGVPCGTCEFIITGLACGSQPAVAGAHLRSIGLPTLAHRGKFDSPTGQAGEGEDEEIESGEEATDVHVPDVSRLQYIPSCDLPHSTSEPPFPSAQIWLYSASFRFCQPTLVIVLPQLWMKGKGWKPSFPPLSAKVFSRKSIASLGRLHSFRQDRSHAHSATGSTPTCRQDRSHAHSATGSTPTCRQQKNAVDSNKVSLVAPTTREFSRFQTNCHNPKKSP